MQGDKRGASEPLNPIETANERAVVRIARWIAERADDLERGERRRSEIQLHPGAVDRFQINGDQGKVERTNHFEQRPRLAVEPHCLQRFTGHRPALARRRRVQVDLGPHGAVVLKLETVICRGVRIIRGRLERWCHRAEQCIVSPEPYGKIGDPSAGVPIGAHGGGFSLGFEQHPKIWLPGAERHGPFHRCAVVGHPGPSGWLIKELIAAGCGQQIESFTHLA